MTLKEPKRIMAWEPQTHSSSTEALTMLILRVQESIERPGPLEKKALRVGV
jgi:hypothetical protein